MGFGYNTDYITVVLAAEQGNSRQRQKHFSSSPHGQDQIWGPPSLILGVISSGESGRSVKLTIHFQLVPSSRMVDIYLNSPIRLHGVMLN
jgi:hypothetical protein